DYTPGHPLWPLGRARSWARTEVFAMSLESPPGTGRALPQLLRPFRRAPGTPQAVVNDSSLPAAPPFLAGPTPNPRQPCAISSSRVASWALGRPLRKNNVDWMAPIAA